MLAESLAARTRPEALLDEASDEDLVADAGRGDATAYRTLVDRHVRPAHALAFRMLGNRADAEETVQEAFLRVWVHAARFKPEAARFRTWFTRILLNLCTDRKRRRRETATLDVADSIAEPGPGALARLEAEETTRRVADAVARLPERQRAALVLCYYEEFSNRDAAAVLETTVTALEGLLVRARRSLRELLLDQPAAGRSRKE